MATKKAAAKKLVSAKKREPTAAQVKAAEKRVVVEIGKLLTLVCEREDLGQAIAMLSDLPDVRPTIKVLAFTSASKRPSENQRRVEGARSVLLKIEELQAAARRRP